MEMEPPLNVNEHRKEHYSLRIIIILIYSNRVLLIDCND